MYARQMPQPKMNSSPVSNPGIPPKELPRIWTQKFMIKDF
jgi:hypothetical protein